jgi:hypothetical protein
MTDDNVADEAIMENPAVGTEIITQPAPATTQSSALSDLSFLNVIVTIGVGTLIAGFIYIGKKLQVLETLQTTTEKIKQNVKVMSDYLTQNADFDHTELQAYSPLNLTEQGKTLIKEVGFDSIFSQNREDFFGCIDSEHPRQKYDVETAAIKSIHALSGRDYMKFLKTYLFNNPPRNMANVAPTLGIYVRDRYLEAHPEIAE